MLDCLDKSFNCGFPAKENWSVFLPEVKKATERTDGGAGRIQVHLETWTRYFPTGGFGQNYYSKVERLGSQIYPGQLTKKA